MRILSIFLFLLVFSSCSEPWLKVESGRIIAEKYLLTNTMITPGINSESSALLNVLSYLGYSFNETNIMGGGGIGYSLQMGEFPILDCSSPFMKEAFLEGAQIPFNKKIPANAESSWIEVKKLLKDGTPVILRVDVRHLTYRYGGNTGPLYSTDGRHFIALFGIDTEKQLAWVSDVPYRSLQTINLIDLDSARSSELKAYPPKREYYWLQKKTPSYRYNWEKAARTSIGQSVINMEKPAPLDLKGVLYNQGINGLESLSNEIFSFEKKVRFYGYLQIVFSLINSNIKENQTDGGAYRIYFKDLLETAYQKTSDKKLLPVISALNDSVKAWQDFASECQRISVNIKAYSGKEKRNEMYGKAAVLSQKVYFTEKKLLKSMKEYISR